MNFSNLKEWTTPKGNVTELAIDGVKVWSSHTTHSYDTLIESSAATCTAEGYEVYACSCGLTERRTLAALGHSYGTAYVSTEFSTGYGQKCSRCGALKALPATKLSARGVGNPVYINVSGTRREFMIVHNGRPSTSYDSSCNGIWLMQVRGYEENVWNERSEMVGNYAESYAHNYLNGTFLNRIDTKVRSIIKQVKIPYNVYDDETGEFSYFKGSSGLSAKVFLLSRNEVGFGDDVGVPDEEGTVLSYFNSTYARSRRIMYSSDGQSHWWERTPVSYNSACLVTYAGDPNSEYMYEERYYRPALILPTDTLIDENFNVIA